MSKKQRFTASILAFVMTVSMTPAIFASGNASIGYENLTETSVTIYGDVTLSEDANIISSELELWSEDDYYGVSRDVGEFFDEDFSSLSPNTAYSAQVVVTYEQEVPIYVDEESEDFGTYDTVIDTVESNTIHFTTKGDTGTTGGTAYISKAAVKSVTDTSATFTSEFDSDGNAVEAYGFAYSKDTSSPTVYNSEFTLGSTSKESGAISESVSNLKKGTTYYVRPYIVINDNEVYANSSTSFTTTSDNKVPTVTTDTVTYENGNIKGKGSITNQGGSNISQKGFVYSASDSNPTLSNNKYTVSTSDSTFNGSYAVSSNNEFYYVRAYATNASGTGYGEAKKVYNKSQKPIVELDSITNITGNAASFNFNVKDSGASNITDRGVVYSTTATSPEVGGNNVKALSSSGTTGKGTVNVADLTPGTKYHVRAYAKNSYGYSYSSISSFTTTGAGNTVSVAFSYKTSDNVEVGKQSIGVAPNTKLTATNLVLPAGYALSDPSWSYTVTTAASVSVPVKKSSTTSTGETEFMAGAGNFTFAPDKNTTRGEVAQVIYNLADDKNITTASMVFTDLSNTSPNKTAIDYCTAKGFMRGYPDGSFKENNAITRAEVAVVLCTVYDLKGVGQTTFTDTANHWGKNYIALAADKGMLNGYPDGSFKPDNTTTRAEVCTIFSLAEHRSLTPLGSANFTDVPTQHWAYKYIMNASIPKP